MATSMSISALFRFMGKRQIASSVSVRLLLSSFPKSCKGRGNRLTCCQAQPCLPTAGCGDSWAPSPKLCWNPSNPLAHAPPFAACVCPTMVIANAASGLSIVMLVLTSGFAIVHGSIPDWAIWAYWISPHAYALR